MKKLAIVLILFSFSISTAAYGQLKPENEIKDRRLYKKIEKLQRIAPRSIQNQKLADQQALLDRFTQQYNFGDGWENESRTELSYQNGLKVEEIWQWYDEDTGWISDFRQAYTYSNQLLSEVVIQYWDYEQNSWANIFQEQLSYSSLNGSQVLSEVLGSNWDNGDWTPDYKVEVDFTGGSFNSFTEYEWDQNAGDWIPYDRSVLTEEGGNLLIYEEYWDDSDWTTNYRTIFSDITKNGFYELIIKEIYELNYIGSWMYYLLNQNLPEFTEQYWNGSEWIDNWRLRIISSAAKTNVGSELQYIFEYYSLGNGWITEEIFEYMFDSSGLLESAIEYYSDYEGGVSPYFQEEYLYDSNNLLERINQSDIYNGNTVLISRILLEWDLATSVTNNFQRPQGFILGNAYPNPFNPSTIIPFQMESSAHVNIRVYDILGRQVAHLVNEVMPAGEQTVRFNASGLSSGIYIVRFETAGVQQIRNITLMK